MGLSMSQRHAVTKAIAPRYKRADKAGKGTILDELCATTGWHRNHARKTLGQASRPRIVRPRKPRPALYGPDVFGALRFCWAVLSTDPSAPCRRRVRRGGCYGRDGPSHRRSGRSAPRLRSSAPAEHTCPELTKAAFRALSTAASKRASAKITFGFLPPSSSATFLTVAAAAAAATRLPVTSPPVNDTRSTSGWLTQRGARHRSGTEYQVGHPRRKPDLGEHAHQEHRGVRGELAGLEDEGVSGRQCRGNLPGRLQQRVVPRRDQPAYAHRLVDDAAEHPGTSRFDKCVRHPGRHAFRSR